MKVRYVTVDVFTDRLFRGNPVAVVLDAIGLSESQMQDIAIEFNYSETTFVLPAQQPGHTAQVRIFTPGREVPFAGHPNIGTAFALAQAMADRSEPVPRQFIFEEKAGLVPVSLLQEDGAIVGAELLAPEPLSRRGRTTAEKAAACLSLAAEDIRVDTHPPQVLSVGLPFLVAELGSRDALCRCAPSRSGFDALLPFDGAHSVYAYVHAAGDDAVSAGADIFSRMFTARLNEDPATGSATGALAAMLAGGSPIGDGEIALRFMQGVDMGRPSLLAARVVKSGGAPRDVYVGGRCVRAMRVASMLGQRSAKRVYGTTGHVML
jgi:trans-2,3-dihydro-3-hydroxyanthranilate isomerase